MKTVAEGALKDPQPAFPAAEWKARVELAACYQDVFDALTRLVDRVDTSYRA